MAVHQSCASTAERVPFNYQRQQKPSLGKRKKAPWAANILSPWRSGGPCGQTLNQRFLHHVIIIFCVIEQTKQPELTFKIIIRFRRAAVLLSLLLYKYVTGIPAVSG